MKSFNSIKLINDDEAHVLSFAAMFATFTLSLFFSIPLYVLSKENSIYIFLVNGFFLILYILSSVFFKNALKTLSKELFGLLLFSMVLFLSYFYYGYELFGDFIFLIGFLISYVFVDYFVFYIKNHKIIYTVVRECFEGGCFNYAHREECRINMPLKRSFLANIILIIFFIILPFLLIFGQSLPYIFFGFFGGKVDGSYLILGMFLIFTLLLLFLLTYIYLFILYLYYFLKVVYQNRNGINNI